MTDQIIDIIDPMYPGPMGDITPEARKALAEMRDLHGSTKAFHDLVRRHHHDIGVILAIIPHIRR